MSAPSSSSSSSVPTNRIAHESSLSSSLSSSSTSLHPKQSSSSTSPSSVCSLSLGSSSVQQAVSTSSSSEFLSLFVVEDVEEADEAEEASIHTKLSKLVVAPSHAEVHAHLQTHIPFAAWCSHCVSGRASAQPHLRNRTPVDLTRIVVHADYCFLSPSVAMESSECPVLVVKVKPCDSVFARMLPSKGTDHFYNAHALKDIL